LRNQPNEPLLLLHDHPAVSGLPPSCRPQPPHSFGVATLTGICRTERLRRALRATRRLTERLCAVSSTDAFGIGPSGHHTALLLLAVRCPHALRRRGCVTSRPSGRRRSISRGCAGILHHALQALGHDSVLTNRLDLDERRTIVLGGNSSPATPPTATTATSAAISKPGWPSCSPPRSR
jgi:hypothetical protein